MVLSCMFIFRSDELLDGVLQFQESNTPLIHHSKTPPISSKPAGNIIFRQFLRRVRKNFIGVIVFDQLPEPEKSRVF